MRLLPTFAALTLLSGAACTRPAETPAPATTPAAASDSVTISRASRDSMGIQIQTATTASRSETIEVTGVLALDETRTARIGARTEGLISSIRHDVGERVAAGAVLAEMHSHIGHDVLATYRSALAEEQSKRKALEFARLAEGRLRRLLADKAASQQELDRAETERVAAEFAVKSAETETLRAAHDLEFYGIDVATLTDRERGEVLPVTTPRGGVILERLVSPGTTVTVATPLFVVADLSQVWAVAEVDETRLARLAVGARTTVSLAAFPEERFEGRIIAIGSAVDPQTRRVVVRVALANADGRLKPNMFATVSVATGEARRVLSVPKAAIQQVEGRHIVFVESGPDTFTARTVELGIETAESAEIRSGLSDGDRVVTTGSFLLKSQLQRGALAEES